MYITLESKTSHKGKVLFGNPVESDIYIIPSLPSFVLLSLYVVLRIQNVTFNHRGHLNREIRFVRVGISVEKLKPIQSILKVRSALKLRLIV